MFLGNAVIIIFGAAILIVGLLYALNITNILKNFKLERPWSILSILIALFFFGYVFLALKFMGIDLLPWISLENLVTIMLFLGAVFVLVLAVLNQNLLLSIFGVGLSDVNALRKFSEHIDMPLEKLKSLAQPKYSVLCDICTQPVTYSIPDIVRSHPNLDRGVIIDKGMGGTNYRFFIRHYCNKEYREIPVGHDSKMEFRTQRPSRLV